MDIIPFKRITGIPTARGAEITADIEGGEFFNSFAAKFPASEGVSAGFLGDLRLQYDVYCGAVFVIGDTHANCEFIKFDCALLRSHGLPFSISGAPVDILDRAALLAYCSRIGAAVETVADGFHVPTIGLRAVSESESDPQSGPLKFVAFRLKP